MSDKKILMTGATGYIADQLLPTFREAYDMVLVDVTERNRQGNRVEGVVIADLIDPDRSRYAKLFDGVDAVVHLAYKRRAGEPLDHFFDEKQNVEMAYNVLRCAYEAGVPRVAMASSNHAADWYEHALIHERRLEVSGRRGARRDAGHRASAAQWRPRAPGGPICPTREGRALFAASGVARRSRCPAPRRNALLTGGKNRLNAHWGEMGQYQGRLV